MSMEKPSLEGLPGDLRRGLDAGKCTPVARLSFGIGMICRASDCDQLEPHDIDTGRPKTGFMPSS
jgi:hypothetical protein